jgi:6-phosphogluconolactonase
MAEPRVVTLADPEALATHVAGWLTDLALAKTGNFAIALSGGSTPKRLFELLAEPGLAARFPWDRTHLFWGDERFVPYDSPYSNYRMTRLALLDHVPIPKAHVNPMPTSGDPAEAARAYQATLQTYYGAESLSMTRPLFDVVLLGLGENGHTASLFPGTPALEETLAWVAPVVNGVPQPRLTLTYPAIACSRFVAFLTAGASKRDVLARVLAGDRSQPATRVTTAGELIWFTDHAAVGT